MQRPRKSPVVDGVVKRNPDGKEIRYITKLTPEEIKMATAISTAFKQKHLRLRPPPRRRQELRHRRQRLELCQGQRLLLRQVRRHPQPLLQRQGRPTAHRQLGQRRRQRNPRERERSAWNLKASVTVFRHGDRTPKQKLKRSFKPSDTWAAPLIALLQGRREETSCAPSSTSSPPPPPRRSPSPAPTSRISN